MMVVLVTTNLPEGTRGALSKWLIECAPGTYVGTVSARVRDGLWDHLSTWIETYQVGRACLAYPAANEQGYEVRNCGSGTYRWVDHQGMRLVERQHELGETYIENSPNPQEW